MDLVKLQEFVNATDNMLNEKYNIPSQSEKAYARMTKVTEEVGELANALGCFFGQQREEKLAQADNLELAHEMADVILTVFLLAKVVDVDIQNALKSKINKIISKNKSNCYDDFSI